MAEHKLKAEIKSACLDPVLCNFDRYVREGLGLSGFYFFFFPFERGLVFSKCEVVITN